MVYNHKIETCILKHTAVTVSGIGKAKTARQTIFFSHGNSSQVILTSSSVCLHLCQAFGLEYEQVGSAKKEG